MIIVIDIINTPPAGPVQGDRYLVGETPTGYFSGHAGEVAEATCFESASSSPEWNFTVLKAGDYILNAETKRTYKFNKTHGLTEIGMIPQMLEN